MRATCNLLIVGCILGCCTAWAFAQGQVCPLPTGNQACAQLQGSRCVNGPVGTLCVPRKLIVGNAGLPPTVVDCSCYAQGQCGPVALNGTIASCPGICPVPPPNNRCEIFVNGAPTGAPNIDVTTLPAGSEVTCDCHSNPPTVCNPTPQGFACEQVTCPTPGQICQPKCVLIDNQGVMHVSKCQCDNDNACQIEPILGGIPPCINQCPPGQTCYQRVTPTAAGTEYCCECVPDPPFCEPTPDGTGCTNFQCPGPVPPIENCQPRCIKWNPQTGQSIVIACDCRGIDECHVQIQPGAMPSCAGICPPGEICVQNAYPNPDGTFTICCDCIRPDCVCPGDINGDGILNGLDIAGLIRCFLGVPLPGDHCECADMDGNGLYTQADIDLFVTALLEKHKCGDYPCCPQMDLSLNLATGVDGNGNLIPVGNNDDDWIVTLDASGGTVPRPATVVTPHPAWLTFPNSQWISANYFGPNGDYGYEFCFCLDPRFKNPVLSLRLRADDAGQVFLNGNFIGNAAGFNTPNPPVLTTSNPAFFQPGQNCVRVLVQNLGGPPTGLNMIGSVAARDGKCCCPPANLSKSIDSGVYDNSGGTLIPVGNDDDTWTVTCDAAGGTVPRPATVITPHTAWLTIPGTQWISAAQYGPNGQYCYQYCFCLDPRFKNAQLVLDLRADDNAQVFLNGNLIGATPLSYAFNTPQPTHIVVNNQALFLPCENCIEIRVNNTHGVVTGVNVAGTITAEDGLCCDDRPLACCLPDGNCIDMAPGFTQCPHGTTPMAGPCQNYRPCCLPDGSCQPLEPRCCELAGGTVMAAGTACGGQRYACCISDATGTTCILADPLCCTQIYHGVPKPPFTDCIDTDGDGLAQACQPPPLQCEVDPLTGRCRAIQCPTAGQECQPRCVLVDAATQLVIQVLSCACGSPNACHVQLSPPPVTATCVGGCPTSPPGLVCFRSVVNNSDGTQTVCCNCTVNPN